MQEIPLAVRFIFKAAGFLAHHQHLKPTGDFDVFLFEIPHAVLTPIHSIIGLVLALLLVEISILSIVAMCKKVVGKIKPDRAD